MTYYLVSPGLNKNDAKRPFYWSTDNGDTWIGIARGIYRPKHTDDIVCEACEAEDKSLLDWRRTPFHDDSLSSGWLSRDGRFYGCPSYLHDTFVMCMLGMRVKEVEAAGWVRVHNSSRFACEQRISEEQRNWLSENGYNVPDYY